MLTEYAHQLNDLGISTIPVDANKRPMVAWDEAKKAIIKYDYSNAYGIAIVCGWVSGGIECIDFDLKYDLTKTLMKNYSSDVKEISPALLEKMVAQSTVSKGFHFVYRCETIEGNKKLARRAATEEETAKGEKIKVLIETRGEGGYFLIHPSPGYKLVKLDWTKIQTITPEERDILFSCATNYNEVVQQEFKPQHKNPKQVSGRTSWEDYNDRGDAVGLLQNHGWTVVKQKGNKVLLKRPGATTAAHSGNFDYNLGYFSVFSTSTQFEPERGYKPSAVFAVLECGGDFVEAAKKLYEMGYGDRKEERPAEIPTKINMEDKEDNSFIANIHDIDAYLQEFRDNGIKMGLTTGVPEWDDAFRYKPGQFNIANGIDNVGKSVIMWYKAVLCAMYNDWTWVIYSSENREAQVFRKLMEFYLGKPLKDMNSLEFKKAREWVMDRFTILSIKQAYNYKDIINIACKLNSQSKRNAFLVDPYNSLRIDIPRSSKFSTYEYHYQAASDFKLFTNQEVSSIYLNVHAQTEAARRTDGKGRVMPPNRADVEGGVMFANKADDFFTYHRYTTDNEDWMWSQIFVRKVKDTETGGKVSFYDKPMRMKLVDYCRFITERDNYDAVYMYHHKDRQQEMAPPPPAQEMKVETKINYINEDFDKEGEECPF